jgi:GNAT superfamily N-acetyltransferase
MGGGQNSRVPIEIRAADPAADPGARLLAEMVAEIESIYGPSNTSMPGFAVGPEQFSPPAGAFRVIWEDGVAVACGGLKGVDPTTGEIKRMYVVPAARSRGLARRLLGALEDAARSLGYTRVRLDTGARQPHALALYAGAGYRAIPHFNDNPFAAHWFEKAL